MIDKHSFYWFWFQFFDGPNIHARHIGTYCGSELPPVMSSTGSTLTVQFISDSTINGKGFLLEWFAVQHIDNPNATPTLQPGMWLKKKEDDYQKKSHNLLVICSRAQMGKNNFHPLEIRHWSMKSHGRGKRWKLLYLLVMIRLMSSAPK